MDELYAELQRFLGELRRFNESTANNWDQLQSAWENAAELWTDDSTRRQFEDQWSEVGSALRRYRQQGGENYEDFLLKRKFALDRYFGHR